MFKLRRTPFRCRGCNNRFFVYVPREKDELEEAAEAAETPETGAAPHDEGARHRDVAKPAEP